jgi:hypothetical protein
MNREVRFPGFHDKNVYVPVIGKLRQNETDSIAPSNYTSSLDTAQEEPYAVPIWDADELRSAALGEYRDRVAQKRLWDPREHRRHGRIRDLVQRQDRIQLPRRRRLQGRQKRPSRERAGQGGLARWQREPHRGQTHVEGKGRKEEKHGPIRGEPRPTLRAVASRAGPLASA